MFVSSRASALLRAPHVLRFCRVVAVLSAMLGVANGAESRGDGRSLPTGGHASEAFIDAWDDDGDGKVSRAEYQAVRNGRFATTDADRGGSLTVDEYVSEYAARLDREIADERNASLKQADTRFKALDEDGDRFVSQAEYNHSGERVFFHLDRNKDARITPEDAEPGARQERRRHSAIAMPTSHNLAGMLEIYDDDGDDVITREQYDAHRDKAFAATDANKDGKLDHDEYAGEFSSRLSQRIDERREALLKQARVRFKAIDADKNGSIERNEYFATSALMFGRADTDNDGVVSQDDPAPVREPRSDGRAVSQL